MVQAAVEWALEVGGESLTDQEAAWREACAADVRARDQQQREEARRKQQLLARWLLSRKCSGRVTVSHMPPLSSQVASQHNLNAMFMCRPNAPCACHPQLMFEHRNPHRGIPVLW
jgi:hypothetical protein